MRQLPQGAWRRGAKLSGRIIFFALQLNFEKEISKRSKLNDNDKSNDNRCCFSLGPVRVLTA